MRQEINEQTLLKLKVECLTMINAYLTLGLVAGVVAVLYEIGHIIALIM